MRTYQRAPVEYALEHRDFAFPELLLLVDAVQSSRFLTQRKSDALVRSVKQLASERQRALLDKRLHVEGRIKMQNESVFHNVDRIQEALARRAQDHPSSISSTTRRRKKVLQHDGSALCRDARAARYTPTAATTWSPSTRSTTAFANYRVDRMDEIEVTRSSLPAATSASRTSTRASLESRAFGMYAGEPVSVELLVDGRRHGRRDRPVRQGRQSVPTGEGCGARAAPSVMKSPVLFGWLAQFGDRVRIEKPASLAAEYRDYLAGIVASYGE